MEKKKIIIAIDGHSSSGKSTLAKDIAKALQYSYIDTGAMYRAATLFALKNNIITNKIINKEKLLQELDNIKITFKYNPNNKRNETYLNGVCVEDEIRGMEVSDNVSEISVIKELRKKMVAMQQEMGKNKGIVMDGRDIGTVVFPNAELKIFVDSNLEVRAHRRFKELTEKGINIKFEEVKENLIKRDHIDSTRAESPLRKANDAILLDNSFISKEEQFNWAMNIINKLIS